VDEFKLSEDTMVGLRAIAANSGELEWRIELLAKLQRITEQQELFTRAVVGELKRLKAAQVGPVRITEIVRTELSEKLKVTNVKVNQIWKVGVWLAERAALGGLTYLAIWLGMRK
jgi:hypothetical protein